MKETLNCVSLSTMYLNNYFEPRDKTEFKEVSLQNVSEICNPSGIPAYRSFNRLISTDASTQVDTTAASNKPCIPRYGFIDSTAVLN